MEGNNIFLPGDDALGYLAGYSMTFILGHPFNTCRPYERFFDPSHIHLVRKFMHLEYPRLLRV